jgi:serine/threonine-protein kinase
MAERGADVTAASQQMTYSDTLDAAGIDTASLELDSKGTLVSKEPAIQTAPSGPLPLLATLDDGERTADVRLHQLLGTGGMGQVFAAEQVCLGRSVAVKVLKPEVTHADALLREALVTGRLQHPGIVPVHQLGRTDQGSPLLVMKRIEGVGWDTALRSPELTAELAHLRGRGDALDFHLDVLAQVAATVAFAHDRGVLHRDLKPANVMLGHYGEVYVVDWGVAAALGDDPVLPKAASLRSITGTPAYMAPEMTTGNGATLSVRSDVFLLGAILYELLAGVPPWRGRTVQVVLEQAWHADPPPLPVDAPTELVAVCRKAMARLPDDRYGTALEFQSALAAYRHNSGSRALTRAADERADQLLAVLALGFDLPYAEAAALFTECRFGYRQALAAWPDNQQATDGLERVVRRMLEYELGRGNLASVEALMLELRTPDALLTERLAWLRKAEADDRAHTEALHQLERDLDPNAGARTRAMATVGVGLFWTLMTAALAWADHTGRWVFGHREAFAAIAGFLAMNVGVMVWMYRRGNVNLLDRRLLWSSVTTNVIATLHWGLAWWARTPLTDALALYLLWAGLVWVLVAVLSDRRLLFTGLTFVAAAPTVLIWPRLHMEIFGLSVLVGLVGLALRSRSIVADRGGLLDHATAVAPANPATAPPPVYS